MNSHNVIEDKVREILIDILDVSKERIQPQSSLIQDLGASSIDLVEISTALQNAFDIDLDDVEASRLVTVEDAVAFVQLALERKETSAGKHTG